MIYAPHRERTDRHLCADRCQTSVCRQMIYPQTSMSPSVCTCCCRCCCCHAATMTAWLMSCGLVTCNTRHAVACRLALSSETTLVPYVREL